MDPCFTPLTKINLKWIKVITVRHETETSRRKHGEKLQRFFLDLIQTPKNKLVGPYQMKNLLHSKGNHQQNEEATYGMGEDICKL